MIPAEPAFDPRLLLELLNGAALVVDGFFLAWGVWYLWREGGARRRHLTVWEWFFSLPPSMSFVVAVLVHDSGVWLRSAVIWVWRRMYGGGDFSLLQAGLLAVGGLAIAVGGLCKIRAVTKPDYGDGPWLACLYALLIFLAGSLAFR